MTSGISKGYLRCQSPHLGTQELKINWKHSKAIHFLWLTPSPLVPFEIREGKRMSKDHRISYKNYLQAKLQTHFRGQ